MNLSPELRARVLSDVRQTPALTRDQVRRNETFLLAGGVSAAVAIFLAAGGVRIWPRPMSLVMATSLGSAAISAIGIWIGSTRGRSMLGRPRTLIAIIALAAPAALLAWKFGVSALYENITDRWPDRAGFRCFRLSMSTGIMPLLAALIARRRTVPVSPAATGAAFGISVGLGTAVLVDLWCPVAYIPHLLLGHVLPIGVLAGLGAWVGARVLSLRIARALPPPDGA